MKNPNYAATITGLVLLASVLLAVPFHLAPEAWFTEVAAQAFVATLLLGMPTAIALRPHLFGPTDARVLSAAAAVTGLLVLVALVGGASAGIVISCSILTAGYAAFFGGAGHLMFADLPDEGYAPMSRQGRKRIKAGMAFRAYQLVGSAKAVARRLFGR